MKSRRSGLAALLLLAGLAACVTETRTGTGVMSEQAPGACLRSGVPCRSNGECCSSRCDGACRADPLASPLSIESRAIDDLPTDTTSGLGTPSAQRGPKR